MCDSCAICLNPVRRTRNTRELPCGHMFHSKCIDGWEHRGGERCPLCRDMMSGAQFRITLNIENLKRNTSNNYELPEDTIRTLIERLSLNEDDIAAFSTEINFDVQDSDDLRSVLADFGIPAADVDTFILNAE